MVQALIAIGISAAIVAMTLALDRLAFGPLRTYRRSDLWAVFLPGGDALAGAAAVFVLLALIFFALSFFARRAKQMALARSRRPTNWTWLAQSWGRFR